MEYKSRAAFLGLPLVHVALGRGGNGKRARGRARGWIAIGDVSFGVLFSCGGVACGGVVLGGIAAGVVALGGIIVGVLAAGGCALGYLALGGVAVAGHGALGGVAVAGAFAQGGVAVAEHVGDELAGAYFADTVFFAWLRLLGAHPEWLALPVALVALLGVLRARAGRQRET